MRALSLPPAGLALKFPRGSMFEIFLSTQQHFTSNNTFIISCFIHLKLYNCQSGLLIIMRSPCYQHELDSTRQGVARSVVYRPGFGSQSLAWSQEAGPRHQHLAKSTRVLPACREARGWAEGRDERGRLGSGGPGPPLHLLGSQVTDRRRAFRGRRGLCAKTCHPGTA